MTIRHHVPFCSFGCGWRVYLCNLTLHLGAYFSCLTRRTVCGLKTRNQFSTFDWQKIHKSYRHRWKAACFCFPSNSLRLKVFVPKKILASFVLSSFIRFFFRFAPEAKLSRIWLKTLALETNLNEQLNSCKKTRVCCIKQPINSRSLAAVQEPVLLV